MMQSFVILKVQNGTQTEIAALYNMTDNTFKAYHIKEHPFCGAHTLLPDGNAILVGGEATHESIAWSDYSCACIV